jgi:hypothetical protein
LFPADDKSPSPLFARPSVHKTTIEPGKPYPAIVTEVKTAGPSAVQVSPSMESIFSVNFALV